MSEKYSEKAGKKKGRYDTKNIKDKKYDKKRVVKSPQISGARSGVEEFKVTSEAKRKYSVKADKGKTDLSSEHNLHESENTKVSNKELSDRVSQSSNIHGESTVLSNLTFGSLSSFFNPILMFVRSETFSTLAKRVWLTLISEVIVSFISKICRKAFKKNYKTDENRGEDQNLTPYKTATIIVPSNGDTGLVINGSSSVPTQNGPTNASGLSVEEFVRQLSLAVRKNSNSGRDFKPTEHISDSVKSMPKSVKNGVNNTNVHSNNVPLNPDSKNKKSKEKISEQGEVLKHTDENIDNFISNLAEASSSLTKKFNNSGKLTKPTVQNTKERSSNTINDQEASTHKKKGEKKDISKPGDATGTDGDGNKRGGSTGPSTDQDQSEHKKEGEKEDISKPVDATGTGAKVNGRGGSTGPITDQDQSEHKREGEKEDVSKPVDATGTGAKVNERGGSTGPSIDQDQFEHKKEGEKEDISKPVDATGTGAKVNERGGSTGPNTDQDKSAHKKEGEKDVSKPVDVTGTGAKVNKIDGSSVPNTDKRDATHESEKVNVDSLVLSTSETGKGKRSLSKNDPLRSDDTQITREKLRKVTKGHKNKSIKSYPK